MAVESRLLNETISSMEFVMAIKEMPHPAVDQTFSLTQQLQAYTGPVTAGKQSILLSVCLDICVG